MKNVDKDEFIKVCNESSSMYQASVNLNMHFNTFKRYALKFGCYNPNQSGKGMKKPKSNKILTEDILDGKYPEYQTFKLKIRLINEGFIEDKCQLCGWDKKRDGELYTPCELHHINGDRKDHHLSNLMLLCPNCHSLTDTYRAKNIAH